MRCRVNLPNGILSKNMFSSKKEGIMSLCHFYNIFYNIYNLKHFFLKSAVILPNGILAVTIMAFCLKYVFFKRRRCHFIEPNVISIKNIFYKKCGAVILPNGILSKIFFLQKRRCHFIEPNGISI